MVKETDCASGRPVRFRHLFFFFFLSFCFTHFNKMIPSIFGSSFKIISINICKLHPERVYANANETIVLRTPANHLQLPSRATNKALVNL